MFTLPEIQVSAQITKTVSRQKSFQSNYMHSFYLLFLRFNGILEISLKLQNTQKVLRCLYMSF